MAMRHIVALLTVGSLGLGLPPRCFATEADELLSQARIHDWTWEGDNALKNREQAVQLYLEYLRQVPDSPVQYDIYYRIGKMYGSSMDPSAGELPRPELAFDYYRKSIETAPPGMIDLSILSAYTSVSTYGPEYQTTEEGVTRCAELWKWMDELGRLEDEQLRALIPACAAASGPAAGPSCERVLEQLKHRMPTIQEISVKAGIGMATSVQDPREAMRLLETMKGLAPSGELASQVSEAQWELRRNAKSQLADSMSALDSSRDEALQALLPPERPPQTQPTQQKASTSARLALEPPVGVTRTASPPRGRSFVYIWGWTLLGLFCLAAGATVLRIRSK